MKKAQINLKTDKGRYQKILVAESFVDRLIGLMFCSSNKSFSLLIRPCNSIHTFFMNFPIDVYFLDKNLRVIKKIKKMKPWHITGLYWRSNAVLEIPSKNATCEFNVGEELELCIN